MPVTIEDLRRHLAGREQARREEGRERARALTAKLPAARRLLVEELGAKRVLLFGSLAAATPSGSSDVDLAVEGLPLFLLRVAELRGPSLEAAPSCRFTRGGRRSRMCHQP